MWAITRERLDEIVDTWNNDVAESEADRMAAEEMLGYLDDPVVVCDNQCRDCKQRVVSGDNEHCLEGRF